MSVTVIKRDPRPALAGVFEGGYADAFELSETSSGLAPASAREWAEASLAGALDSNGRFARLIWGGILTFDLGPLAGEHVVAGWRVSSDEPDRCTLDVDGRLMDGRMTFERGAAVTWTTQLRFHNLLGRAIWAAAGVAHRASVPGCLRRAQRTLAHRSEAM